jgi:hypothetical protein
MKKIPVFFYGSYMNRAVLAEVSLVPGRWDVARLAGHDIVIRPRANLVPSDRDVVWGFLASATHAELDRLYRHAHDVLGERYLPEAVLVECAGAYVPALCYLTPAMEPRPAAADYVDRIVTPARQAGFPDWYVKKLESFRP